MVKTDTFPTWVFLDQFLQRFIDGRQRRGGTERDAVVTMRHRRQLLDMRRRNQYWVELVLELYLDS